MLSAHFVIPSSHPCLSDHFPGQPIAPGVLTLDHVSQALLEQIPAMQLAGFPQVKFLKPVLPAQQIEITYTEKKPGLYQFSCMADGITLVTGQIRLIQKGSELG